MGNKDRLTVLPIQLRRLFYSRFSRIACDDLISVRCENNRTVMENLHMYICQLIKKECDILLQPELSEDTLEFIKMILIFIPTFFT